MSLIRSTRNDRRRRSMREAVATESGVAVEAARARTRRRLKSIEGEEATSGVKRDPGYSQEVRFACQQRLVQLIPVRKSTMASVASVLVSLWASLLLLHYIINMHSTPLSNTSLALFFHVRSPNSLCHWIGQQLWMFTGIVSLLIYQLRRHKLDDYRAKYRIWLFLATAAFFSSFDVSSSALQIIGVSVDPWTQSQFGLPGWPVVLSGFASIVGVLGLRLCTELKSSPGSVTMWLFGLTSWAFSAVIGTGLFKIEWAQATIDLVVGATWLGGIVSVFLASTLYLRYTYIQAQKRFALRNKWLAENQKWNMPKISLHQIDPRRMARGLTSKLRRKERPVAVSVSMASQSKQSLVEDDEEETVSAAPSKTYSTQPSLNNFAAARREEMRSESNTSYQGNQNTQKPNKPVAPPTKSRNADDEEDVAVEAKKPKKGWLPWKRRSEPADESGLKYSDVGEGVRARDRGLISGYEKVNAQSEKAEPIPSTGQKVAAKKPDAPKAEKTSLKSKIGGGARQLLRPFARRTESASVATAASAEKTKQTVTAGIASAAAKNDGDANSESKRSWSLGMFKRTKKKRTTASTGNGAATSTSASGETKAKKSFFSRGTKGTSTVDKPTASPKAEKKATGKKRFSLFGFLDGMALKPPAAGENAPAPKASSTNAAPPLAAPSSQRQAPPLPSTAQSSNNQNYDEDEDDSGDYRNLSKAERKKLRRQNNQNRAA